MSHCRFLVHAFLAASCGLVSTASHAILISDSGVHSFSWSYDSSDAGTLFGDGTLQVGFTATSLTVVVTLTNNSADASDRLTSFGFGIDPNATAVRFADMDDAGLVAATMDSIPSLTMIEVCAFGGPNCSGGGNGGILGGGGFDRFSLVLDGTWGSQVNIAPIGFKYQTDNGSYEFTTDRPPPPPTTSVPEPSTLGLLALGAGLIGLGQLRRRRRVVAR